MVIIGICLVIVVVICITVFIKNKPGASTQITIDEKNVSSGMMNNNDSLQKLIIQMEMFTLPIKKNIHE